MVSPLLVRRSMPLVILALAGLAAALQARGLSLVVGEALASHAAPLPPLLSPSRPAAEGERPLHRTSADAILARSPFDSTLRNLLPQPAPAGGPTAPSAELPDNPYDAPVCDGVRVLATAVVDDVTTSFAILARAPEPDGAKALIRQGDTLGEQKVWLVAVDRVWLWSSVGLCQAGMTMPPPRAAAAPRPATPQAEAGAPSGLITEIIGKIKRLGPNELVVDRSAIDKIRDGFGEIARTTRFLPEFENGKPLGVKMMAVKPGSLWEALGLQTGDRIEKINGFDVGSPESMLQAYGKLTTADELRVELSRAGKKSQVDVHIK